MERKRDMVFELKGVSPDDVAWHMTRERVGGDDFYREHSNQTGERHCYAATPAHKKDRKKYKEHAEMLKNRRKIAVYFD